MKTTTRALAVGLLILSALTLSIVAVQPPAAVVAQPQPPVVQPAAVKPPQPRLSPSQAVVLSAVDIDGVNSADQPFMQYLFKPRVEDTDDEFALFENALRLHVNLLSREAALAYPYRVAPGLWRVDRRDFDWRKVQFDNLAKISPYFFRNDVREVVEVIESETTYDKPIYGTDPYGRPVQVGTEKAVKKESRANKRRVVQNILFAPNVAGQLSSLALLTQSQAPILRADWFIAQTCRQLDSRNREDTGTGYYDFLQFDNKNINDYFKLIGLRQADVDKLGNEMRAVVRFSGVSAQNRQIVLDYGATGPHWKTLEFFNQSGRGVAINNLRDGEAEPDAFEHYGHGRNGLPFTALNNAKGVLQSTVPDQVATNRCPRNIGQDGKVHVNFSCWQCHSNVLQDIADDVRATYTGRLTSTANDKRLDLELRRAYTSDFQRVLQRDKQEHADVIRAITGLSPSATSDLYSKVVNDYLLRPVTLTIYAREIGVTEAQLLKGLVENNLRVGRGDFRTDNFLLVEPTPIPRLDAEDSYTVTQDAAFGVFQERDPTIRIGGEDKQDGNKVKIPLRKAG